jgi:hypothetical protein
MYPLPAEVRESDMYAETFRRITSVWVAYFYTCAGVRLVALLVLSADAYVVVSAITGAPFIIALLVWSVRHGVRRLRAALETGAVIA